MNRSGDQFIELCVPSTFNDSQETILEAMECARSVTPANLVSRDALITALRDLHAELTAASAEFVYSPRLETLLAANVRANALLELLDTQPPH